ncbi:MAG: arginase [Pseudomonadales bacterium]|nr:arginase [Pseudomonadales bacterium]
MNIQIVGAACSVGGRHSGCRQGPEVFKHKELVGLQQSSQHQYFWNGTEQEQLVGSSTNTAVVREYCRRLRDRVREVIRHHDFPVVIGGDHSCAIGTWAGVTQAQRGSVGMLWIDAHMDSHTPTSSGSGKIHGMPVACLLGEGDARLVDLGHKGPIFSPQHTCLVGVRSFESTEPQLLQDKGVSFYTMEQVNQLGLAKVISLAYKKVSACPTGFGVSIDLDALDPQDAPGVSVPEPDGLKVNELLSALRSLPRSDKLKAIEIAEFNPEFDTDGRTSTVVSKLIHSLLH